MVLVLLMGVLSTSASMLGGPMSEDDIMVSFLQQLSLLAFRTRGAWVLKAARTSVCVA